MERIHASIIIMAAHISVFTNLMEVLFVVVEMVMYLIEMEKVAIVSFHRNFYLVLNFGNCGKFKFCEHTTIFVFCREVFMIKYGK